jgi:hypothetical protein
MAFRAEWRAPLSAEFQSCVPVPGSKAAKVHIERLRRYIRIEALPRLPSFISRVCSGSAPCCGGLQSRLA